MIIKPFIENKNESQRLERLLGHSGIYQDIKEKIQSEERKIIAGISGEKDAARILDEKFGQSQSLMVLHDLRMEYKDSIVQIDHILVNSFLEIFLCESKSFRGGVAINESGEFTAFYNKRPYPIPSPIEQNRRQVELLGKIIDLNKPALLQDGFGDTIHPSLKSYILVSTDSRITRPEKNFDGLDTVVKVDQFFTKLRADIVRETKNHSLSTKSVPIDTLRKFANGLATLHKPKPPHDWIKRFGLDKLNICQQCYAEITNGVMKFCLDRPDVFGGMVYCMDCQPLVVKN